MDPNKYIAFGITGRNERQMLHLVKAAAERKSAKRVIGVSRRQIGFRNQPQQRFGALTVKFQRACGDYADRLILGKGLNVVGLQRPQ